MEEIDAVNCHPAICTKKYMKNVNTKNKWIFLIFKLVKLTKVTTCILTKNL